MKRIVSIEPPEYDKVIQWLDRLENKYGSRKIFEYTPIGKSVMGRDIAAVSIGNTESPVLYCGGVHGREWITTLLLMTLIEDILSAYCSGETICDMDVIGLLDSKGIIIVPSLDPDGVEISIKGVSAGLSEEVGERLIESCRHPEFSEKWKSNARGVDINRNFDAAWDEMRSRAMECGINGPSIGGWTGRYPESEPETQAIVKLCESTDFRHIIAFHSQGEEIYWSYRSFTPPKAHLMGRILSMSSGYPLCEPELNASSAGLKDWFMQKYHRPAFTVEVGRGECPLPLSCFRFLYSRLREMMMLGMAM